MQIDGFSIGNGGWVVVDTDEGSTAYVRFADEAGRLVPIEFYMPRIRDARTLKAFPLGQLEAIVNAPDDAQPIRARMVYPAPQLSVAASYVATNLGTRAVKGSNERERVKDHWAHRMLWSQRPDGDEPPAPTLNRLRVQPIVMTVPDATLNIPARQPYGDDFYREFAQLYSELATVVRNPATVIHEANPNIQNISSIHRWVRETRRRGFLGPARHGVRG